jgi:hypothetical protein
LIQDRIIIGGDGRINLVTVMNVPQSHGVLCFSDEKLLDYFDPVARVT